MDEAIQVALRTQTGKSAVKKLRKAGLIPATVYGLGEPTVSLQISPKILAKLLASETGMNSLIFLQREGTDIKRHVMVKDLQRHPVTGRLVHVDFMRVDPSKKVRVRVPIRLVGTAIGIKEGGMLEFVLREAHVESLPGIIPTGLELDVTDLRIGDNARMEQLRMPEHIELLDAPHTVVCILHGKKVEEEGTEEAAAAAPAK